MVYKSPCYNGCEWSAEYDDGLGRLCLHPDSPYYCECDRIRADLPEPDYCPLKVAQGGEP